MKVDLKERDCNYCPFKRCHLNSRVESPPPNEKASKQVVKCRIEWVSIGITAIIIVTVYFLTVTHLLY